MILSFSYIKSFRSFSSTLLLVGLSLSLFACQNDLGSGEEILATVGTNTLKRKDLSRYLPEIWSSEEDSLRATKQFVDRWVSEHVLTDQALGEIDGLENRVEYKVKDYRNRLILNEYYQYLIQTRLDTVVDSATMANYFLKHSEKYKAEESYYQLIYIGTYDLDIRKPVQLLTANPNSIDLQNLKLWAMKNAFFHQTDTITWLNSMDLENLKASLQFYGNIKELRPGHYPISWTGKYDDKPALFIIRMNRVISPGQAMPSPMIVESVKQGIINERTRNILEAEKIRLVREAKEKGNAFIQ